MSEPFTCFQCGDGNTPLYCLNCAGDILHKELERVRNALRDSNALLRDIRLCDDDEGKVGAQISDNNDLLSTKP